MSWKRFMAGEAEKSDLKVISVDLVNHIFSVLLAILRCAEAKTDKEISSGAELVVRLDDEPGEVLAELAERALKECAQQ